MLWLWLVSGLVGRCLCSGVHPAGSPQGVYSGGPLVSSEAHGPLARQALLSGGFPFLRHHDSTGLGSVATPLSTSRLEGAYVPTVLGLVAAPVATRHFEGAYNPTVLGSVATPLATRRLEGAYDPAPLRSVMTPPATHLPSSVELQPRSDQVIKSTPEAPVVSKPKHTLAVIKVRRPVIRKCDDIDNNVVAEAAQEDSQDKLVTVSRYHPVLPHAISYPFVSYYYPFQVPVQAYPPAYFQQPQGVQVPQQTQAYPQPTPAYPQPTPVYPQPTPVYPQRPVLTPRPPQQYPQHPQQPVYGPPPQQTPISPPAPQRPTVEFDDSDTVVIDNPDFGRSASGQRKSSKETITKTSKDEENPCDEEEENAKRIVSEFQNRRLLRLLKQFQPIHEVLPTHIQTLKDLEEVERSHEGKEEKSSEDYSDGGLQKQYFSPASSSEGKTVKPKLKTTLIVSESTEKGRDCQQTFVKQLSDSADVTDEGLSDSVSLRGRLLSAVTFGGIDPGPLVIASPAPAVSYRK